MHPCIICHIDISIDGRRHYEAEGWIVGRKTMAEMARGTERPMAVALQVRPANLSTLKNWVRPFSTL